MSAGQLFLYAFSFLAILLTAHSSDVRSQSVDSSSPPVAPVKPVTDDYYGKNQELLERVRVLPGVESDGAINHLPLAGDIWGWPYWIEGRPIPRPGDELGAVYRVVMSGYFRSMNIPILRGRDISASDTLNSPGVVVVNELIYSNS